MAFGDFAGGFAEEFAATRRAQEEKQRAEKMAKLQGQLVELQIKHQQGLVDAQKTKTDALGRTQDAMVGVKRIGGREVPDFSIPEGEVGEIKRNRRGLSEILADEQLRGDAVLGLGIDPIKLMQEDRLSQQLQHQKSLAAQFNGGFGDLVPTGATLDSDGTVRRQFGINPERQTPIQSDLAKNALFELSGNISEAMTQGQALQGTLLEPGRGVDPKTIRKGSGAFGFVRSLFGGDEEKQQKLNTAFDKFSKAIADIQATSPAFVNATTDTARRTALAALPDENKTLAASASVMANILEETLTDQKTKGIQISPQEEAAIRAQISELRSFDPGGKQSTSTGVTWSEK